MFFGTIILIAPRRLTCWFHPLGFLIARGMDIDLFQSFSGNIDATNVGGSPKIRNYKKEKKRKNGKIIQ